MCYIIICDTLNMHFPFQETSLYGATVKVHEPMGVIAIACPDEKPLLSFVSLFAPAIIRGNCVIMVPSEKHPLSALDMYQVCIIIALHILISYIYSVSFL